MADQPPLQPQQVAMAAPALLSSRFQLQTTLAQ